jgi:HK97 family phage major capsid protein
VPIQSLFSFGFRHFNRTGVQMKNLLELKQERENLIARAQAMVEVATTEKRELSDEENAEIDSINNAGGKIEKIDSQIERLEKIESRQKDIVRSRTVVGSDGTLEKPEFKIPASARRGNLKAFKGAEAERDAYSCGQFIAATLFGSDRAKEWCNANGVQVIKAAHSTTDNSKGGFLVPDPMEAAIIRLVEEYGSFRRNVRVYPMPNGSTRVPKRSGGFTPYYVGENTAITASDLAFQSVSLVAKKLGVLTQISSELLEDSIIQLADLLATEFAYALAVAEDAAGFLGDGTATYGGITGLEGGLDAGALVTTASNVDTFGELTIGTVDAAVGKLARYPGIMPKWYMHSSCWSNAFERLAFAAGGNSTTNFNAGMGLSFKGYPVEFVQSLPKGIDTTDLSGEIFAYFGDLSMTAAMGDSRGITIASDSSKYFAEDALAVRCTERFDINVHDVGDANIAGAMVGLKFNAS